MPDVIPNSQASSEAADPVAAITALLDAEKVTPEAKPPVEAAPEPEHEPALNAEVEGAEAVEEVEKPAVAEIPLEQLEAIALDVTFKSDDGKDVTEKLTVKELRDGFMMKKDYSKKTAELARQREESGEKTRQAIDSERSQYQESLKQLQALILETAAPELKNVDWNNLAANDPFEYVRLRNRAEQLTTALNTVKSKETELTTKQQAEKSQLLQKKAQATWQQLEADIPGFNKDLYQSLLKAGIEVGVSPETVNNWVDAGEIKLLHKAYLYDQLKAGKPADNKKVVVPPTAIKPGASNTVPAKVQRQGKALDQLRKTGTVNDLAAVIASQL
jgi:hypothetical protein